MNERQSLMRAICENPACDTARLVYADWLYEFGDHNDVLDAEQIRVQIHFAFLGISLPWRHPTISGITGQVCRGLVERLDLTTSLFDAHCEVLFQEHPITGVRFAHKAPRQWPVSEEWSWAFWTVEASRPNTDALPFYLRDGIRNHPLRLRGDSAFFGSKEDAITASSETAVNHARKLVGFPELSLTAP